MIPGSAGQPRDGNPAACYATLRARAQQRHLPPCPLRPRGRKIRGGLPERLAARPASYRRPQARAAGIARIRRRSRRDLHDIGGLAPPLEEGEVVDGFLLEKRLHQGGMASMWRVIRVDAEGHPAPDPTSRR